MRCFFACVEVSRASGAVWALAALAGLSTLAGADLAYPNFNSLDGLSTTGVAAPIGGAVRLTGAAPYQVGALWALSRQRLSEGFTTEFAFRFDQKGGGIDPLGKNGADGFAFVIQNAGPAALQNNSLGQGGGLGYNGMSNLIVVEFDTWMNTRAKDPNGNHISVLTAGHGELISTEDNSLGWTTSIPLLDDGSLHTARIEYTPGTMRVYLDGSIAPCLNVSVSISDTISLDQGGAYVGFTGATGGAWQNQDIHSWTLTTVPSPGAAALFGVAGLGAMRRRRRA